MPTDIDTAALTPIVRMVLARRKFLDYCSLIDPQFIAAKHIGLIADRLEKVERGEIRRLAICLPPRHGKTALVSQKFTSWYLGRNPSHQVILASYGAELAEGNSRNVRALASSDLFPFDLKVREDSRAANRWETTAGGVIVAVGTGGGLTGRGGHLIVCDDLVKDRMEAESDAIRASTADWFSDVLRTRMMPDAKLVMVGTRWHEDDVLGRVLQEDGWEQIILPLIAEEDDALGRAPGDWLWPERFNEADVPSVKRGEISSRSFAALYQQRPSPASGSIFKLEWLQNRFEESPPRRPPAYLPNAFAARLIQPPPMEIVTAVDCAAKDGVSNDFSVIATVGRDHSKYYLLNLRRERLQFADLLRAIQEEYKTQQPLFVVIEGASSGFAIVQEIKRFSTISVLEVPARGSKAARAESVTPLFESGKVWLPKNAPWLKACVDEFISFPVGRHDDQVDAVVLGLSALQNRERSSAQRSTIMPNSWRWR